MLDLWQEMMGHHARLDPRFRPRPWPQARKVWATYVREDILSSDRWCALVATKEDKIVGQILGVLRDPPPPFEPRTYGYVTDIVVDPRHRRRGIGRTLFYGLRDWMRQHGADHLQLQVLSRNPGSQAFWRSVGCTDYTDVMWYSFDEEE